MRRLACAVLMALAMPVAALAQTPAQPTTATPTRAEIAAIQREIQRAWVPPQGAHEVRTMEVDLRVALDADGFVVAVATVDQARKARDPIFRRAAESAEAAVRNASPLPVPREKASFFKQFVLRFAPPRQAN